MKAAGLYRVSTKRQVRGEDDSISVQREVVHRYARQNGLELVREYVEPGVSAYRLSSEERDILQDALKDARLGVYQVLLVFKADRLSRNAFEYPMILWEFYKAGVEIIAAAEDRRLNISDQMEKLVRFIEGWQAETESKNTSIRVSIAKLEKAKRGEWCGGRPPYGYRLSEQNRKHRLEIDPREATVVREMVRLCMEEGLGTELIARELNRRGFRTRQGKPWTSARVRGVLQNSILCGLPAYNCPALTWIGGRRMYLRRRDRCDFSNPDIIIPRDENGDPKPIPEYQILTVEEWFALSDLLHKRQPGGPDGRLRRSPSLLGDLLRCGYCGGPLVSHCYTSRHYRNGKCYAYERKTYRCRSRMAMGREACSGPSLYSQARIDGPVMAELLNFFSSADLGSLEEHLRQHYARQMLEIQKQVAALKKGLARTRERLESWIERLNWHFAEPDESPYTEEFLAAEVRKAQEEVKALEKELLKSRLELREAKEKRENVKRFVHLAPRWFELFREAAVETKRAMLRHIIDCIIVWRDRLEIRYSVSLAGLARAAGGSDAAAGNIELSKVIRSRVQ